jgi:sec-independent protein translocase protein TatB
MGGVMLAGPDLLVVLVIALIVFGPKKLPELAKTVGKALAELKKTTEDVKDSIGIKELDKMRSNLTLDLFTDLAERVSTSISKDVVEEASGHEEESIHLPIEASPPTEKGEKLEEENGMKGKNTLQLIG